MHVMFTYITCKWVLNFVYIIIDFIYVYFENIRLCDLNLIFWLSIHIYPFPYVRIFWFYFPNPLPFPSENIETEVEIGFFRPFPTVFIPSGGGSTHPASPACTHVHLCCAGCTYGWHDQFPLQIPRRRCVGELAVGKDGCWREMQIHLTSMKWQMEERWNVWLDPSKRRETSSQRLRSWRNK
jgi:hypothetical protein